MNETTGPDFEGENLKEKIANPPTPTIFIAV